MVKAIRLSPLDNVATLLEGVDKNEPVTVICTNNEVICTIDTLQSITFGNKIAIKEIESGSEVTKAGFMIGNAIKDIPLGQLVHVQNVRSPKLDIPEAVIEEIIKQMGIEE